MQKIHLGITQCHLMPEGDPLAAVTGDRAGSRAVPGRCSPTACGSPLCTEVLSVCSVGQKQIPNKGISSPLLCRWFSASRRWRGRSRSVLLLHRLSMVPQHLLISSVHQEVRSIDRPGLLTADGDSNIPEPPWFHLPVSKEQNLHFFPVIIVDRFTLF